jgi:hypothetical protein
VTGQAAGLIPYAACCPGLCARPGNLLSR